MIEEIFEVFNDKMFLYQTKESIYRQKAGEDAVDLLLDKDGERKYETTGKQIMRKDRGENVYFYSVLQDANSSQGVITLSIF